MLWIRLLVNNTLLVVKFLLSQKLYVNFQLWERGLLPLMSVLFKGQIICAGAPGGRALCFGRGQEESLSWGGRWTDPFLISLGGRASSSLSLELFYPTLLQVGTRDLRSEKSYILGMIWAYPDKTACSGRDHGLHVWWDRVLGLNFTQRCLSLPYRSILHHE